MSYTTEYPFTSIINYLRRSRKDEERERRTGEDTLAEQKVLMTNVLDNMGIPYVQKFEIGSGDKISTRPVFQEVLEELKLGKYDAVAVKEISRLGRGSYSDMGQIYDLITTKRIFIVTPYKIYDPTNDSDLRQIRFEMFLSREEFETIKTRLISAKYTYALQGKFMGGNAAFGYRTDEQKMKLIVDDEKAKIVRLIYEIYNHGLGNERPKGIRAIANYLSSIGIPSPTGKPAWGIAIVKNILTNPVYKGEIHYRTTQTVNGKKVPRPEDEHIIVLDAHEPIIEEELWELTQNKFASKERKPSIKPTDKISELTGLIRCSGCGYKMITNNYNRKWTNKDGSVTEKLTERVRCLKNLTPSCGSVQYRDIEQGLLEAIKQYTTFNEEDFRKAYNVIFSEKEENFDDVVLINIEKQLKTLNNRLEFIYEKYESGIYTDEEFKQRKNKIEDEKKKLTEMEVNPPLLVEKTKIERKEFTSLMLNVYEAYMKASKEGNLELCNQILKGILDEVNLMIISKGSRSQNIDFELRIKLNPRRIKEQSGELLL
ncbi:recombinase family protein [Bacillus sp. T33-2]|uniref:recombinase family protein n=1 Tax=Bacillus sp. T33-2 TaxID=2054168 RepID=UPI0015E15415|nr:recombinase family protein [Bacillus sp. T33-2]